jgi:hypothetical protein
MPFADAELLGEQRRMQKTGDIRLGRKVPDDSKNGFHPAALETFRFTSPSEYAIRCVAERLGGEACEWARENRRDEWQVTTKRDVIAVLVPAQQVISQWYEMWRKNMLLRRCDSQVTSVPGGPCQCPHAEDPTDVEEVRRCSLLRDELAKKGEACARYTRLNLQVPSLPDIGVWRSVTGGFWAAGELAMKAETLRLAREAGAILPAVYRLEPQLRPARPGEPARRYVVPKLELLNSVHEILSGQIPRSLGDAMDMLLERAAPILAIETAPAARRAALTAGPATPRPVADAADEPPLPEEPPGQPPDDDEFDEGWQRAQRIYDRAVAATTPDELRACGAELKNKGLGDDQVCTDHEHDIWEPAMEAWRALWRDRARGVA